MVDPSIPFEEIVVVIAPSSVPTTSVNVAGTTGEEAYQIRVYDALIYTNRQIENLNAGDAQEAVRQKSIGNLPLAGRERVVVNWTSYQRYIFKFFFGEKSARSFLRNVGQAKKSAAPELFEIRGDFLNALFAGKLPGDRETRVWWHSELPEVVALPWELIAYKYRSQSESPVSFLRGLPPQNRLPRIPISGPLKVAFIHEPRITSKALLDVFANPPPNIKVTQMTGPPREALLTAARDGYEVVHLVTDGTVSLANDGTLYLRKGVKSRPDRSTLRGALLRGFLHVYNFVRPALSMDFADWVDRKLESELDIDKCSPGELSALLLGSRIGVLSFSAPKSDSTSIDRIAGYLLPKVYRAFCSLGSSTLPLPTIVAPVGATDDPEMIRFWRSFYTDLGDNLDSVKAMAAGLKDQAPLAMALFQRHSESRVFTQISAEEQTKINDPTQVVAALQLSEDLVMQLKAQFGQYSSMPESFQKLLLREMERQERLKTELEPWIETGRDTIYE
jgi:hypothetical protein